MENKNCTPFVANEGEPCCNQTRQKETDKISSKTITAIYIAGTKGTFLLYFILVCFSMTSCIVTQDARTTQIEIMKPGIFNISDDIKTVALINSVPNDPFIPAFNYINHFGSTTTNFGLPESNPSNNPLDPSYETKVNAGDTTIKYRDLSNTCMDALAWVLKKEGYFSKVINYQDSLTLINPSNKALFNPEKLFQETQSDICIFLDRFSFGIEKFKDFKTVTNIASLSWTILYKKDTLTYTYKQRDTLTFVAADFTPGLTDNMKIKVVVNNSSTYLGKSFCSKIIPTWIPVDRVYYASNNSNMLQAEKFALNGDWLKAAEIWNTQTKSKKSMIAAKASFNMALACEMQGKFDTAIEWLVNSSSLMEKNNKEHPLNCQDYISALMLRKKELVKLRQQVRN